MFSHLYPLETLILPFTVEPGIISFSLISFTELINSPLLVFINHIGFLQKTSLKYEPGTFSTFSIKNKLVTNHAGIEP